jgi:diguanylate cyclase (GGDEF)-like protein/PAS domain S-box-containing protein
MLGFVMTKIRFLLPVFPIILGVLALAGWGLDLDILRLGITSSVTMNPATAAGFILLGLETFHLYTRSNNLLISRAGQLALWVVIIASAMKLSDLMLGTAFSIDQRLFATQIDKDLVYPSRMAPNTAICFVFLGLALQFMRSRAKVAIPIAQALAMIPALFALLAIVGYMYGVESFYGIGTYLPMTFNTATAFLFLSVAVLCMHPHQGYMFIFTSGGPAGKISSILFPATLIVPFLLGWITLTAQRAGIFNAPFEHAISVILDVTIFFALSYISVRTLFFSDMYRQKTLVELRDSAARIKAILDTVVDGIITIDERGIVETFNPAAARIFGYTAAEVIGRNINMLMPEPHHSHHDKYLEHYRATGEARVIGIGREVEGRRMDGSLFPMDMAVSEMWLNGQRHFTGSVRDITERRRAEDQLHSASLYARNLIETSFDPLVIISLEGKITDVNEAATEVTGVPRKALIGSDFSGYFTEPDKANVAYQEAFAQGFVTNYPLTMRHVSGKLTEVLYNASTYPNEKGEVAGVAVKARDISDRKRAEQAEELASRDSLTGLYNHRTFYSLLEDEIARTKRYNRPVSLLMLDIDYFKRVNDIHGHQTGDAILKGLSDLLLKQARTIDRVCRYGGEEFTVILPETDVVTAMKIAERLRATVERQSFNIGGSKAIAITASIGVATYPQQAHSPEELVKASDIALYAAKGSGRNQVCCYELEAEAR